MENQKLYLLSQEKKLISSNVKIAENFFARAIGLMGKKQLPESNALWIKRCSHIHTFFMRFSIDLIFVDKDLVVKKVFESARPWKHLFLGSWGSDSVFELPENTLKKLTIHKGDQLYVGN